MGAPPRRGGREPAVNRTGSTVAVMTAMDLTPARKLLETPVERSSPWAALGAAAVAAMAAVLMAGAIVLGPGVQVREPVTAVAG